MHDLPLITTLAVGFTAAWVLGIITQRLRLSPIVGYLLAGVLIGPHTPGFVGDIGLAHQLAEVGVILLMFGVGLHFHLKDLMVVKWVAIPGALGQSAVATLLGIVVFRAFGFPTTTGVVIGMAMAVASTVVLIRVLMDANELDTQQGHIAVGWLLVEDVMTVVALVMIPVLGIGGLESAQAGGEISPALAIAVALLKLVLMVVVVLVAGARIVPWVLVKIVRLRSRELFTLTVLVFSIAIAAGSYALFGASMALGAFLAGMVVAQTPVSHQAAADALPLRDAFSVLFFVSVGMLFDPTFLLREPLMMLAALAIILVAKPLSALAIVALLGYSTRTALTVALALAQIGEFSFILSDSARKYGLMPDAGHNMLVGGAIISITINPMLFRMIGPLERWLQRRPRLWALLNARGERRAGRSNTEVVAQMGQQDQIAGRLAIVIGFGPVGQTVNRLLHEDGLSTVIIDLNMDTVSELNRQGQAAIFGDATRAAILEQAGIARASHLVVTLPHTTDSIAVVGTARHLNSRLRILVRARYLREREELEQVGATAAVFEEAEAAVALARLVLADAGASRETVEHTLRDIRTRLLLDNVSNLASRIVRDIMIPWTRVRRLSSAACLEDIRTQIQNQHYSRWPVIDAQTHLPIGYLLVKDLVGFDTADGLWTKLIRPLSALRSDDTIESALRQMQQEGTTVCLVADGQSPVGMITIEDILEQVVGRMEDEYPRHPKLVLHELTMTTDQLLDLSGDTMERAIAELAAAIPPERLPSGANIAELAIARERELPTNVGCGVAIPHARCPNLQNPLIVFGRSNESIAAGDGHSAPVQLLFLLVTPAERPDLQIALLSGIASIAANPDIRRRLLEARSQFDVQLILADAM